MIYIHLGVITLENSSKENLPSLSTSAFSNNSSTSYSGNFYPVIFTIPYYKSSLDIYPSLSISNALNAAYNSSFVSSSFILFAISATNSEKSTSPLPS